MPLPIDVTTFYYYKITHNKFMIYKIGMIFSQIKPASNGSFPKHSKSPNMQGNGEIDDKRPVLFKE